MIQIDHVSFAYENNINGAAITDNSVEIPTGQVVLLCGESGSGKTTFSRLINGLIPSYYEGELFGEITVVDKNIRESELYELAPYIGSVFQNPKSQFYTLLTDTEIVFACENLGIDKDEILTRFDKTVTALKIDNLLGKSLFALSGGEKQKIACASVGALIPDVFVLDEPTSNLDIGTIKELQNILLSWKAQGKTIIIAEHRLEWLRNIADRVLFFKDGHITYDLSTSAFWSKSVDEIHGMGLRANCRFEPHFREISSENEKLEFRNFSFAYNKNPVLDIPFFEIPRGSVIAVLGDNGAGKTTFARCLCGLMKKSQGLLTFEGKECRGKDRTNLCYMVMQDVNHQLFSESVLDEVVLGIDFPTEEEKDRFAEKILSELDLLQFKDAHPMSLSGGQRQRVAIAGAVASHKEIIVFDEPTSGLDYRHMREVAGNIRQLSKLNKTQFIITHDPELVVACCDSFMFIENGELFKFGGWTTENVEFVSQYFNQI